MEPATGYGSKVRLHTDGFYALRQVRFAVCPVLASSFKSVSPCTLHGGADIGNVSTIRSEVCHGVRLLDQELQEERGRGGCVDGACGVQAVGTHSARVGLK